MNESFNLIEATLKVMSEAELKHIVRKSLKQELKAVLRQECRGDYRPDPATVISKAAEKLQRHLSAEGASRFASECVESGIDFRNPKTTYESNIECIGDIMSYCNAMQHRR